MRPTSYRCPTSHYTRQPCRTLISVCQSSGCYVIPAGWTFREGPGQKTTANVSKLNQAGPRAMD